MKQTTFLKLGLIAALFIVVIVLLVKARGGGRDDVVATKREPIPHTRIEAHDTNASDLEIRGMVVIGAKAAPGANVRLLPFPDSDRDISDRASEELATASKTGEFVFRVHRRGRYLLSAELPGFSPAILELDLDNPAQFARSTQLVLRIEECHAWLLGTVSDSSGGPIEGAKIGPRLTWDLATSTSTDSNGHYKLCTNEGLGRFLVEAQGYGTLGFETYVVAETQHDIALLPEAVIEGSVVRRETDEAVGGALVECRRVEGDRRKAPVLYGHTEPNGKFHIGGLKAGRWVLKATSEDAVSSDVVEVVTLAGETTGEVTLRLDPCYMVRGTVKSDDVPVIGRRISTHLADTLVSSSPVYTQEDGEFSIACVPEGANELAVHGYTVVAPKEILVEGDLSVEVSATARGTIMGRVLRDSHNVAGAEIAYNGGTLSPGEIYSNAAGYSLEGLTVGTYRLCASNNGLASDCAKVEVGRGENKTVDLVLQHGARLEGQVVDDSGQGVPRVFVMARGQEGEIGKTESAEDGSFAIHGLRGGNYQTAVFVSPSAKVPIDSGKAGYPQVVIDKNEQASVTIEVNYENREIRGFVVAAGGGPIRDARVKAIVSSPQSKPQFLPWLPTKTTIGTVDGAFTMSGLENQSYALRAETPDGRIGVISNIRPNSSPVEIVVEDGGNIRGTLVGFTSRPIVFAARLADSSGRKYRARVDGDGFRLNDVPAGIYSVTAQSASEGASTNVSVTSSKTETVTLESHGSARIRARILDLEARTPVPGYRCNIVSTTGDYVGKVNYAGDVHNRADGIAEFEKAPAGRVVVQCVGNASTHSMAQAVVQAARGQVSEADVLVVKKSAAQSNIGLYLDFDRISAVVVYLYPNGPSANAGFKQGDRIVSVDGRSMEGLSPDGVRTLLSNGAWGTSSSVEIERDGRPLTLVLLRNWGQ